MTDTMEYKGYIARIEYDGENKLFYGIVQNTRDTIHFEGTSAHELEDAFRDSVEAYFEFCEQCGDMPNVPVSNKLWIELDPKLQQRVALSAQKTGKSVDAVLSTIVEAWYSAQERAGS